MTYYLSYFPSLLKANMKAALSLRASFFLQMLFMLLNNVVFFSIWIILFQRVNTIGGLKLGEFGLLFGLIAGAYGLGGIVAGGVREIARIIQDGRLDAYLLQPGNLLLNVVCSRSKPSGWGDLLTAPLFFFLSDYASFESACLFSLFLMSGAVLFVSVGIILQCLAFWFRSIDTLAEQLWEYLIMLSAYPLTIYPSPVRVVLMTVIPAGLIGFVPFEVVKHPTWSGALAVVCGATLFLLLATVLFASGLKRYESGSLFSVRE